MMAPAYEQAAALLEPQFRLAKLNTEAVPEPPVAARGVPLGAYKSPRISDQCPAGARRVEGEACGRHGLAYCAVPDPEIRQQS